MSKLEFTGTVRRLGDYIDTDAILPAKYLNLTTPVALAEHCLESYAPDFRSKIQPNDIIVAGKNFGCGSSREHAPMALMGCGVSCIIAESFSRIFFRNAINLGLPTLELPEAKNIADGARVHVDCATGTIVDETCNRKYLIAPLPIFMQEILLAGGVINRIVSGR